MTTACPVARSSDPDAMEIDAIDRVRPAKLTPPLKAQIQKEGKCFCCRNKGHRVKDCRKKATLAAWGDKPKN